MCMDSGRQGGIDNRRQTRYLKRRDSLCIPKKAGTSQMGKVMLKEKSVQSIHHSVNSKAMYFMIAEDLDSILIIRNRYHLNFLARKFRVWPRPSRPKNF